MWVQFGEGKQEFWSLTDRQPPVIVIWAAAEGVTHHKHMQEEGRVERGAG